MEKKKKLFLKDDPNFIWNVEPNQSTIIDSGGIGVIVDSTLSVEEAENVFYTYIDSLLDKNVAIYIDRSSILNKNTSLYYLVRDIEAKYIDRSDVTIYVDNKDVTVNKGCVYIVSNSANMDKLIKFCGTLNKSVVPMNELGIHYTLDNKLHRSGTAEEDRVLFFKYITEEFLINGVDVGFLQENIENFDSEYYWLLSVISDKDFMKKRYDIDVVVFSSINEEEISDNSININDLKKKSIAEEDPMFSEECSCGCETKCATCTCENEEIPESPVRLSFNEVVDKIISTELKSNDNDSEIARRLFVPPLEDNEFEEVDRNELFNYTINKIVLVNDKDLINEIEGRKLTDCMVVSINDKLNDSLKNNEDFIKGYLCGIISSSKYDTFVIDEESFYNENTTLDLIDVILEVYGNSKFDIYCIDEDYAIKFIKGKNNMDKFLSIYNDFE